MTKLKELISTACDDVKDILKNGKKLVTGADEIGKKAAAEGNKTPSSCMKYIEGVRRTKAEIEEEKKRRSGEKKKKVENKNDTKKPG